MAAPNRETDDDVARRATPRQLRMMARRQAELAKHYRAWAAEAERRAREWAELAEAKEQRRLT